MIWYYHDYGTQEINESNLYLDGGEILSAICPPHGWVTWADTELDNVTLIAWGYGNTEIEAMKDLQDSIKNIEGKLNDGQEDSSNN